MMVCVCLCVCVWEREREREGASKQTDGQRQNHSLFLLLLSLLQMMAYAWRARCQPITWPSWKTTAWQTSVRSHLCLRSRVHGDLLWPTCPLLGAHVYRSWVVNHTQPPPPEWVVRSVDTDWFVCSHLLFGDLLIAGLISFLTYDCLLWLFGGFSFLLVHFN